MQKSHKIDYFYSTLYKPDIESVVTAATRRIHCIKLIRGLVAAALLCRCAGGLRDDVDAKEALLVFQMQQLHEPLTTSMLMTRDKEKKIL